jgi:biotin transporter BioY
MAYISGVMAEGPVMGQFVGPVKAHLIAPVGFLAGFPIAIFLAD